MSTEFGNPDLDWKRAIAWTRAPKKAEMDGAECLYTRGDDLFPDGLAYDPVKHVFYMGSMYHRKIIQITIQGRSLRFRAA